MNCVPWTGFWEGISCISWCMSTCIFLENYSMEKIFQKLIITLFGESDYFPLAHRLFNIILLYEIIISLASIIINIILKNHSMTIFFPSFLIVISLISYYFSR